MKIAIIGRTGALIESARALRDAGHTISLVITARAAAEYDRGAEDFRAFAAEAGAAFAESALLDSDVVRAVVDAHPADVGVSLNFPTVIGQAAIDRFRYGILNAHGGDLPRYRGNACQAWALINGETRVGLCVHRMVGGELDSGPVIVRRHRDASIDTRVGELHAWMTESVPGMFVEAVEALRPDARFEEQPRDPALALRCYPRRPDDGRIDWRADRDTILRLINASSEPYAGAFTFHDGEKVVVWRAARLDDEERYLAVPGQVARVDRASGSVDVITGQGKLRLVEVERGGHRGRAADFLTSIRARLD